jgi:hypothetical protein
LCFIFNYAGWHYAECHYAESYYAECHNAECHNAECRAECHYGECHYADCRYAECRYAEFLGALLKSLIAEKHIIVLNNNSNLRQSFFNCHSDSAPLDYIATKIKYPIKAHLHYGKNCTKLVGFKDQYLNF